MENEMEDKEGEEKKEVETEKEKEWEVEREQIGMETKVKSKKCSRKCFFLLCISEIEIYTVFLSQEVQILSDQERKMQFKFGYTYSIQFNSTDFLFDFLNLIHTGYNRLSG